MPDLDWTFPYPTRRMPVLARNVVATSQPLAAQAGLSMLRRGGNAVDAAVATAMALTVVEPTSNGIGADAFALVWAGGGMHGLNASGRAPGAMDPARFLGRADMPRLGWDSVTVPGAVSAWSALAKRFGTMSLVDLAEPAIGYARDGFPVSPQTAGHWDTAARVYQGMEAWQTTFAPGGRSPRAGEIFRSEDHARTLEAIAASGGAAFYEGTLARRITETAKAEGGPMSMEDLAAHEPEWVRPISIDYRGWTLHEIPPNGQGLIALLALGMLRHHAPGGPDEAGWLHLQIEAMKLAMADGHRFIADPTNMDVAVSDLLDGDYLRGRAEALDPARAGDPGHGTPRPGGTVLLCAADASGMMVSLIQSNYTGFGSGVVIPGTGIAMQNRGACFTPEAGHPNAPGPGKRPFHTIIPGLVTRDGEPVMVFGVMGGPMQPQGHAQVLVRMADHGQNPQAALDAPRFRVEGGRTVAIEPGFAPEVYEDLVARGHDLRIDATRHVGFGGGQAILRLDDGYFGASDGRRDGQAVGF